MENDELNNLVKKAVAITAKNDAKTKENNTIPIINKKEIQFRDFKLYYGLINNAYEGHSFWFVVDFIGLCLFPILAIFAINGKNESIYFLYFQVITIIGSIFFAFKMFLMNPFIHILKYPFYKNWIKNCSIQIIGWNEVCNTDDLLDSQNWYKQCSITITLATNCSQTTKKLITAAYIVFMDNANTMQKQFNGGTETWKLEENKLEGSANNKVLGYLHKLISNDLNLINKTYKGIFSIEIKASENTMKITYADTE